MDSLDLTKQFGRYLRAAPIKIFAGSEKTVYYVHPGVLLACKSSTADVHMSGSWKDIGDGAIDWTDFDEQTIERVLHYLYMGNYHIPDYVGNGLEHTEGAVCAVELPPADEILAPPPITFPEVWPPADEPPAPSQSRILEESLLGRPITPFQYYVDTGFPTAQKQTAAGLVAEKDSRREKYTAGAAALTHAKVYSFAHRHFFSDLGKYALQHLVQILHSAPCTRTVLFPHLGDAIRHIYDTTPGPGMQDDPARKLLSKYFALNYTNLAGDELSALAEEGGELMVDISKGLLGLLATKTSEVCSLETEIASLCAEAAQMQTICNAKEEKIQQLQEIYESEEELRSIRGKKKKLGSRH